MGTRSTTHSYNDIISDATHLVSMYKQYDGYLSGYGRDLAEWLVKMTVVGGYNATQETGGYANGMGCLAAQLIARFKQGSGGGTISPHYKVLKSITIISIYVMTECVSRLLHMRLFCLRGLSLILLTTFVD